MNKSYRSHLERLEEQLGALASEFTRVQRVTFGSSSAMTRRATGLHYS